MQDRWMRQSDILPVDKAASCAVTIIGCGAVGSIAAVALAKAGIGRFYLWDYDTVSEVNIPVQWFTEKDINKNKAEVLKGYILEQNPECKVVIKPRAFSPESSQLGMATPIVIAAVDNMRGRKQIWEHVKEETKKLSDRPGAINAWTASNNNRIFIDPRMGAEISHVLTINPGLGEEHFKQYESEYLFEDSMAYPARCTEKATIYASMGTAAIICSVVRKHLTGEKVPAVLLMDWFNLQMSENKEDWKL